MTEVRAKPRTRVVLVAIMVIVVVFLAVFGVLSESAPSTMTKLGKFTGRYKTSYEGNKYEAYEGIPYALPPLADRRFEAPVPWTEPWSGGFLADKMGQRCLEYDLEVFNSDDSVQGSEDCLKLNVYVPRKKANGSLPVLFWIHDGAFQYGRALPEAPYFLIDHGVVVVTIDYRLGTLGFLSTEDEVVSGNMGLKDQVVALKWVNEHIASFGGDPKRITLVGLSAGGSSVHYHYLSPMSAGLFHSGISLSGTALMPWAQTENSRQKAFELGDIFKCPTSGSSELVKCLKEKSAYALVKAQKIFMPWRFNPFTPFGPMAERFSKDPFLRRSPMEAIRSGEINDVPWVTGIVSEEGLYPAAAYYNDQAMEEMNENWHHVAPLLLDYYYTIDEAKHGQVADVIRRHYLQGEPITRKSFKKLIAMVGDRIFNVDAVKAAKAQAYYSKSPVYFYYYSYRASMSLGTEPSNSTDDLGVCHGDDAYLVLGNEFITPVNSKRDLAMLKDLIKMWTSVAYNKISEFSSSWQKVDSSKTSLNYLHITGPGQLSSKIANDLGDNEFWSTIGFKENE